jgi:hypothetical protein
VAPPRPGVDRALAAVAGVTILALVAEYLLGLWTNLYGPSVFTRSTSYPALAAHYGVGYALGALALIVVVLAAMSHRRRALVPAVVLLAGVALAGLFGAAYVRSSPNATIDSFAMGFMFLVALVSAFLVVVSRWPRMPGAEPPAAGSAPAP